MSTAIKFRQTDIALISRLKTLLKKQELSDLLHGAHGEESLEIFFDILSHSTLTSLQNFNSAPASPLKTPLTVTYWPALTLENSADCSLLNQQVTGLIG